MLHSRLLVVPIASHRHELCPKVRAAPAPNLQCSGQEWLEKASYDSYAITLAATQVSRNGPIARMYRAVTRNIEVVVTPRFVADRSSPENNYFFWAYTISITNKGADTVQLKTRHWRITDANGRQQEVRGAGVVGEEPVLKAGETFEYTSGVPLQTASGFMAGTYGMVTPDGRHLEIEVPAFSLDSAETKRTIN
jgi:ApaG protein